MGKSQKFVNVRREQVMLDEHGMPTRPPPEYNPLRPEASGLVLKSGSDLETIRNATGTQILNPHVPTFITKAPWYSDLKHVVGERKDTANDLNDWYERGKTVGQAATKYRKGACENCGAMTHKTRDCVERPRKVGAKFSGKGIKADEVVQEVKLGFEAKRDRWNGFDASEQLHAVKEWELVEKKRQEIRLQNGLAGNDEEEKADSDEDDEKDEDKVEGEGVEQKVDGKNRITVRNLRIREDTAKYLRNLDPKSAYYDPKTRSMRDNPYAGKDPKDLLYAGDNFERYSGHVKHVAKLKNFAWGNNTGHLSIAPDNSKAMTLQSNPTQAELLYKHFQEDGGKAPVTASKLSLLEKYGGEEYFEGSGAVEKALIMGGQTEEYIEYNAVGEIIKGREKVVVISRWTEDVLLNNHTEVWGSYYEDGEWGFGCCEATIKGSYCGGQQAIDAKNATRQKLEVQLKKAEKQERKQKQLAEREQEQLELDSQSMPPPKSLAQLHKESLGKKGPATLQLERIEKAKAEEAAKLEKELIEIRLREKEDKEARERAQLERAIELQNAKKAEDKALKFGFKKNLADSSAIHQYNIATGGKGRSRQSIPAHIAPPPKPTRLGRLNNAAVLELLPERDNQDTTPHLPQDAKIAQSLKTLELMKLQAQGARGLSYLRNKRKWEMTEEEKDAERTVQHHKDDPMAQFVQKSKK